MDAWFTFPACLIPLKSKPESQTRFYFIIMKLGKKDEGMCMQEYMCVKTFEIPNWNTIILLWKLFCLWFF